MFRLIVPYGQSLEYGNVIANYHNLPYAIVLELILVTKKFDSPREFLETFIRNYIESIEENFEVFFLVINDGTGKFEQSVAEFFKESTDYLEKNIENNKIDPEAFALTITGFTYIVCIEKHKGRAIFNQEQAIENFMNNSIQCVQ